MLKRLIEVALPLKEISLHSAREKSIRHGHISTLHLWWARRPLAACRAVVFASLIPDPDDPACPASFRSLVNEVLSESQYKPKHDDGSATAYALNKIMKTTHTATIDSDSQFYVIWKWSYGEAKVPADEAFKLAQALGMDTETMWDRTGVLEKAGENVLALSVAKRMKIKNLGEPSTPSTPASLIDVLHRLCVFREKNDTEGMTEFLGRSGQGRNPNLWLVAQAVSEILPEGDKEKQLMQGLLNQRDQLEEAGRQQKLF
jgi:adenine-specific DNA methylase